MPEIIKAIILGIIQGLTEFLPVSSSGHLELAKYYLSTELTASQSLMFTVILHVATALSTLYVFRKDVWHYLTIWFKPGTQEDKKYILFIVVSMIPAVLVGLFLNEQIEWMFDKNIVLVSCMLITTGILLFFADAVKTESDKSFHLLPSLLVGIAQAFAILPGISRSGATISMAIFLKINRTSAARFSFLMVVPLIFGKIVKDVMDGSLFTEPIAWAPASAGFLCAFITGVLACNWMIRLVKRSKLKYFGIYCIVLGTIALLSFYFF